MLYEVITGAIDVPQPEQGIDPIGIDREGFFEEANSVAGALRHECVGSFSVERIDFVPPTLKARTAPMTDCMNGLSHAYS